MNCYPKINSDSYTSNSSYVVVIITEGAKNMWDKGLEEAIKQVGVVIGDYVKINKLIDFK